MRDYTLQEIYKLENNSSIKLSSFNEEINKKYMISKPEVFDFITNGDTTKGFVIYPVDYDKIKLIQQYLIYMVDLKQFMEMFIIMKCKFGQIWVTL